MRRPTRPHAPPWLARALALTFALAGALPGQIDRIAYRHWAWLEQQRRILLADILRLPPEQRRRAAEVAAEALCQNREKLPLLTIARAIARVRGVEPDGSFCFRSGLQVYALPEVLAKGRELAVTVHAPYSGLTGDLPQARKFRFELRVLDGAGEVVRKAEIAESEDFTDLRQFRCVRMLDLGELPEGAYQVQVDAILDGERPRPTDLPLRVPFAILHDYRERAGALRVVEGNDALLATLRKLAPLPQAVLHGAAEYGSRPWSGTPGTDPRHAMPDLLAAERIRRNVEALEFPLRGVTGRKTIALPVPSEARKEVVFVNLELSGSGLPEPGSEAWQRLADRPLVLVMSGVPRLDCDDKRPSFPHYALPNYLAEALHVAGFCSGEGLAVAVVESPGRMLDTRAGIDALLEHLPRVLPFDPKRLVLVGDGYGAGAMADLAQRIPDRVRGLVLVNGTGGLATPQLRTLRALPILVVPGLGRVRPDALQRLRLYAEHAGKTTGLRILDDRKWPYSIALPLASEEIEAFARRVTAPGK